MSIWRTVYGANNACTQLGSGGLVRPIGKSIMLIQNVENPFKCYWPSPLAARYPGIPQDISEYQNPQNIQLKFWGDSWSPQFVFGNYACQIQIFLNDNIYQQSHFTLRVFHPKFTIASAGCTWYGSAATTLRRINYLYEIIPTPLPPGFKTYFEQHNRHIFGSVSKQFPAIGNWGVIPPAGSPVEIYHSPAGIQPPQQIYIGVAFTDQYGFFSLDIDSPTFYNREIPYGDKVQAFCFEKTGYPQIHTPYAGGEQIHFQLQGVPYPQDKMYPVICRTDFQPDSKGNTLRI